MKKGVWLIGAVVVGTIALTWLVWYQTWFGARLDDEALLRAMEPASGARDVQHGIEEITRRFDERRAGMDRWAKLLVDASRRAEDPVRVSAAWAMHFDAGRDEFTARLREMVASDTSVLVKRNAAPSLAKAGDASARPVLRSMLDTSMVVAPAAGVVSALPGPEVPVRENGVAGRVRLDDGTFAEIRAAVPGRVLKRIATDGSRVAAGDAVLLLAPDAGHVVNAAKALSVVGTQDDLELLGLVAAPQSQFGDEVRAVALQAIDAIRARGK